MTTHITNLSTNFQDILALHSNIISKRSDLLGKLQDLKNTYNELVKQNTKKLFIFCLDSLFFQYKTLSIEMEDIARYLALINNRMYCDYYKLYKIILEQSTTELNLDVANLSEDFKKYPHYKDLEQFHEYKMNDIIQLHSDILTSLKLLYSNYASKIKTMNEYNSNVSVGISINNFLHTLDHENSGLQEHIHLYINYLEYFHISHNGYLSKILGQVDGISSEIEENVLTTRRTNDTTKSNVAEMRTVLTSSSLAFKNKPNLDEYFASNKNAPVKTNDEPEPMAMYIKSPIVQEKKTSEHIGENITISLLGTGTGLDRV